MMVCGFHGLRCGVDGSSRGARPKESWRSCSSWSVRPCCFPTLERMPSNVVIDGGSRRSGRYRPGEHLPPPSWNGRNRCPTRTMSGSWPDVGGIPMMALLIISLVCLSASSRCLSTSRLGSSTTVLVRLGAGVGGAGVAWSGFGSGERWRGSTGVEVVWKP